MMVLCALLLCLPLAACAGAENVQQTQQTQSYAGYSETGAHLRGGIPLEQANLKTMEAFEEDGELCLRLSFMQGSRISGSEDEKELLSLPSYDVYTLPTPNRLVIELEGLAYWDYTRTADLSGVAAVDGYFQHLLSDGNTVSVFVQMRQACAFRVEEEDGVLLVRMKLLERQKHESEAGIADVMESDVHYYALADIYREYCSGTVSREMEMHPSLTKDLSHIVLISAPFSTPMEAEKYRKETAALTQGSLETQWYTAELRDGELPPYSAELNIKAVYDQPIYRRGDEVQTAKVLLEDGLYLCTLPEKNGVLYSKRITDDALTGDSYSYEQLYAMELGGAKKRLFPYEFETIESARYSPDGRKLAILERAAESTHLYIFDVEAKEMLVDLTEVGFGNTVSDYCWDALGSVVYAVSGSNGMQLHQYDFNVPDETKRYSVVDANGADESNVAYCGGSLYFVETDMEQGAIIYRIKPEGGVRKVFSKGANFVLSPDNTHMAINDAAGDFDASGRKSAFRILDMQSGETQTVTEDFSVYSFFWATDCTRLYYFENRLTGSANEEEGADSAEGEGSAAADPFPYTLWVYDLQSKSNTPLFDLSTTRIAMSGLSEKFYVNYLDEETMGGVVRASYEISAAR